MDPTSSSYTLVSSICKRTYSKYTSRDVGIIRIPNMRVILNKENKEKRKAIASANAG